MQKLLFNLNPQKAAGPDQIILTNLSTPPILKHLFQKSLDSETFPPIWKDANVASERSALMNPCSSCWSMIFSNPSIRKGKLILLDFSNAFDKVIPRNSLSNYMTMV